MGKKDPRVDAHIAKSAAFAQPILKHLRKLAHAAVPEVEETLKWGFPHFMHKGMLFGMAGFKQHCTMGFWKGKLILAKNGQRADEAMGQFGRITRLADLPADKVLIGYIKQAAQLNEEGIKKVPSKPRSKAPKKLVIPPYFMAAVRKNKKALATFEGFSYSHKKEYVEWVTEAKTDETRQRRLDTAVEWLSQGKSRHWKYQNC